MKFRQILMSAVMLPALVCTASNNWMVVEQRNGDKSGFLLADNPMVRYTGGDLVVNGSASTSYALSNVLNYHFSENAESGVDGVGSDVLRVVGLDEQTLQVQNGKPQSAVSLLNVGGVLLSTQQTDADGSVTVALPQQKGVYVLYVGGKSFKLIRK